MRVKEKCIQIVNNFFLSALIYNNYCLPLIDGRFNRRTFIRGLKKVRMIYMRECTLIR